MTTMQEKLHIEGHEMAEIYDTYEQLMLVKAKHNLDMDWIFKLLCDADDALSILETNPDAVKVAHKRIKSAMKYAQEN